MVFRPPQIDQVQARTLRIQDNNKIKLSIFLSSFALSARRRFSRFSGQSSDLDHGQGSFPSALGGLRLISINFMHHCDCFLS
jgi:hypothetical protein